MVMIKHAGGIPQCTSRANLVPGFQQGMLVLFKKVEGNIRDFEGEISEVLIFTVCKKLGVKGKGLE